MREKLTKRLCPSPEEAEKRGTSWAWWVYFVQIPFVIWYAKGWIPIHPIVVMLPLASLLNFNVEKRGRQGLGLRLLHPGRSLFLAVTFVGLSFLGWWIALQLEGATLESSAKGDAIVLPLVQSFLVGVFIIALWEEIINRGYIQTRLQAAWGFWGVIVTSLLFASMHIPSTWFDYDNDIVKTTLRFVQAGLVGFALGYVYWRSASVLTTIAIHGLNNFLTAGVFPLFSDITAQQLFFRQAPLQFWWLVGQVGLTLLLCRVFFKGKESVQT